MSKASRERKAKEAEAKAAEQTPEVATPNAEPKPEKVGTVSGKLTERLILARYPHAIPNTLCWDAEKNRQTVEAALPCGHVHRVATSDLFQVKACPLCRKAARKDARKARKAERKALIESLSA